MKVLLLVLETIVVFIVVSTIIENITYKSKLAIFLDNQILYEEKSTSVRKLYYKTDPSIYTDSTYRYPGTFCDILVTTDSSVEIPFIHDILSATVGGHAGLVGMQYQDAYYSITDKDTIDITHNNESTICRSYPQLSWDNGSMFPNYYILRVNLTENQMVQVFNEVISCLGDPYNMTFLLNTKNSSYCSDLVSKAFRRVGINLNPDFGATTVIDLLASNKCEIVGYKEVLKGVSYYYTL